MSSTHASKQQRRRRALRAAAPAAGLLAAGLLVWQGSYSAFSATTQNNADVWTAGTMTLTNNGGGAAYAATTTATFNEVNLKPGSSATKCITVKSVGTSARSDPSSALAPGGGGGPGWEDTHPLV